MHFHFTPTYSSWLNQVEIWFSQVERDVIAQPWQNDPDK
jgi:transposase